MKTFTKMNRWLRDRPLFTAGGGRREGYYIRGEGHSFLSSMVGRALFKKKFIKGRATSF